jgi:hypothetical protein
MLRRVEMLKQLSEELTKALLERQVESVALCKQIVGEYTVDKSSCVPPSSSASKTTTHRPPSL